ncbi:WbqC family protein [Paenibacillus koleovorans]|uniref:WbqC family protein n=1 Tax=Paenibacillus koleovorans TaxID=121608 RepID=UPI0013E2F571|nr:WbqC family protein [Paenibacillus koleovorans]
MNKVCVYQPNVFPPLHYINRILNSDIWVMLDDVQLNKRVGQTSFELKVNGVRHLCSIPVGGGGRIGIQHAKILYDSHWTAKLQKLLCHAYRKSAYFDRHIKPLTIEYLTAQERGQADFRRFCANWMTDFLAQLGWKGAILSAYELGLVPEMKASERMAAMVKEVGGTHYVCGMEGYRRYLSLDHFRNRDLSVLVQNWSCPVYPQTKGPFLPNLSVLDLLAHLDLESAMKVLLSGGTENWPVFG